MPLPQAANFFERERRFATEPYADDRTLRSLSAGHIRSGAENSLPAPFAFDHLRRWLPEIGVSSGLYKVKFRSKGASHDARSFRFGARRICGTRIATSRFCDAQGRVQY